jgi:hypothetical protein
MIYLLYYSREVFNRLSVKFVRVFDKRIPPWLDGFQIT